MKRKMFTIFTALLLTFLTAASAFGNDNLRAGPDDHVGVTSIEAEYPAPTAEGMSADEFIMGNEHGEWWFATKDTCNASYDLQEGMTGYYSTLLEKMLSDGDSNNVCSPVNIYIA